MNQSQCWSRLVALSLWSLAAGSVAPAHAQLSLTLTPLRTNLAAGSVAQFRGVLQNDSPTERIYLNGITVDLSGAEDKGLTSDASPFLDSAPAFLEPKGELASGFSGLLFLVSADASILSGVYQGSVLIQGGADGAALGVLQTANFTIFVPSDSATAPEPSSLPLLLPAIALAAAFSKRKRPPH